MNVLKSASSLSRTKISSRISSPSNFTNAATYSTRTNSMRSTTLGQNSSMMEGSSKTFLTKEKTEKLSFAPSSYRFFSSNNNNRNKGINPKKTSMGVMKAADAILFIEDIYRKQHPNWTETQVAIAMIENMEHGFPAEMHEPLLVRACEILRAIPHPDSRSEQQLASALVWLAMLSCKNASSLEQYDPLSQSSLPTFTPFLAGMGNANALVSSAPKSNIKAIEDEWKTGAQCLEEVMRIYDRSPESKKKNILSESIHVDLLNLLGHIYDRLKDSDSQRKLGDRLWSLGDSKKSDLIKSYAYNNYGLAHRSKKQFEDALKMQRKALRMQKKVLGDSNTEIAKTNELIGHTHCQMDEFGRAVKDYSAALNITKKIWEPLNGEHPSVASLLDWIGFAYSKQLKFDKATQIKKEQIDLLEKIDVYGARKLIIEAKKKELEKYQQLAKEQKKQKPQLKLIRENAIKFAN